MDHELIQQHDRALTTLQTEIKVIASDIKDIKDMMERHNRDHRSDDRIQEGALDLIKNSIHATNVEVATLKTRVYYISGAVGLAASLLMKWVGG